MYTEIFERILEGHQGFTVCTHPLPEAPLHGHSLGIPCFQPSVLHMGLRFSFSEEGLKTLIALPSMKPLDVPRVPSAGDHSLVCKHRHDSCRTLVSCLGGEGEEGLSSRECDPASFVSS